MIRAICEILRATDRVVLRNVTFSASDFVHSGGGNDHAYSSADWMG